MIPLTNPSEKSIKSIVDKSFDPISQKIDNIQYKMTKMKFSDIPRFTRRPTYHNDVPLDYVEKWINDQIKSLGLQLNPDFQRGHVWTEEQQILYIEYLLHGGASGKDFYFNRIGGMHNFKNLKADFVCVDGLQRITAILAFVHNEIPAFSYHARDYDDLRFADVMFSFYINDLTSKKDVLRWYIEMNSSGTIHTKEELEKVKKMIEKIENTN